MAFPTWDPATVAAVTLSGGDLAATNTGTTSANQGARVATTEGKTAGKFYFELAWTTIIQSGGNFGIGIGTTVSTYTNMGNGGTTGVVQYRGGSYWSNGVQIQGTTGSWTQGQIAGIAVDLDNRRIWFRAASVANSFWNGNVANNPATNVGGLLIPAGTMVPFVTFGGTGGVVGNKVTANFGATAFAGPVPSGFTSGWGEPPVEPPVEPPPSIMVGTPAGAGRGRMIRRREDHKRKDEEDLAPPAPGLQPPDLKPPPPGPPVPDLKPPPPGLMAGISIPIAQLPATLPLDEDEEEIALLLELLS